MRTRPTLTCTLTCLVVGCSSSLLAPQPAMASASTPAGGIRPDPVPALVPSAAAARSRLSQPTTTASANARINQVLAARAAAAALGPRFTMTVWDSATGDYVYTKRAGHSLRGASNQKLLTTVAVLHTLGPDHRMPTRVLSGGAGEIILKAGGDPLLTSANLRELARDTAQALASGATSGSPSPPGAPTATSGSPASAPVVPTPGSVAPTATGEPSPTAGPGTSSPSPGYSASSIGSVNVRVDDSLFPGSGQSRGWLARFMPGQVRPVNAFARDDNKARDAAADAGRYFATALRRSGVRATYRGERAAEESAAVIATFTGHTIGQAVARTLLVSDNDAAEMLFRQVAVGRGQAADWDGSRSAVRAALAELDIPLSGVELVDGSGLSAQDRLTAGALTAALARALSPNHPRLARLPSWLPVAGRTGTLAASTGRFRTRPARCAAGLIQAKTGTLADAMALTGYARGADGRTKVFVAIVNGRPTRFSRATTRRYIDRAAASVTGCW